MNAFNACIEEAMYIASESYSVPTYSMAFDAMDKSACRNGDVWQQLALGRDHDYAARVQ